MLNKDLKYYKELEYSIIIEKQEMDGETWYIAYANEFGKYACFGRGENQIEALNNFLEEKDIFIEYLFHKKKEIPEPKMSEYEKFSGFFNVRTSSIIHAILVNQAKELGISLNLYLNQILSSAVENKKNEIPIMNKIAELCSKLDTHHFEVTKQLRYQRENLYGSFRWAAEYSGDKYLKTA